MPEGLFLKLPAGPACERCASRTYIASIEPHPDKRRHTRHVFECPRCYHLTRITVAPRGHISDDVIKMSQYVINAELLVERQTRLVRRLQHQGRDITRAEALLEVLQESLEALRRYQEYLVDHLSRRAIPDDHD